MPMPIQKRPKVKVPSADKGYGAALADVIRLIESARRAAARSVNAVMTATYWAVGRRIVEQEQGGARRAGYGQELLKRLSRDLTSRVGRGFSERNLEQMRRFYLTWPMTQTPSARSLTTGKRAIPQTLSAISGPLAQSEGAGLFPLPWSHYVRLLSIESPEARRFYEAEALRGGWTVRQLTRQINSQFYERTMLSRNKASMLTKGRARRPEDAATPEEEIKSPYVLEFLGLKDEYAESELKEALVQKLESFLLELGGDFAFIGRQRRLRVGNQWFKIDLLFFHRRLRCLVVIDLKLGELTHADAGQMHLYLNYVRENWTGEGENPPVGLILCAAKDASVAHYALEGLPNKILAATYRTKLPDERTLAAELAQSQRALELRGKRWNR